MTESLAEVGSLLPGVARQAIAAFVRGAVAATVRSGPPAPVFVTLRAPDGSLRGCIGSTRAITASVTEETARSAVLAASRDPRFPQVVEQEVAALQLEVSVLLPPEPVASLSELAPDRYGVIVREPVGKRQGLLLPGIDGIHDAGTQVTIARRKAGLDADAPVELSRFEVLKFFEAS